MRDDKDRVSKLIKAMLNCVGKSSAADIEAVLSGSASFVIVPDRPQTLRARSSAQTVDSEQIAALRRGLMAANSREAGDALLEKAALSRKGLEALAKTFDMTVRKDENVERIRARIVATSIGSRLNASAIRGDDTGR